jgi:hypothetical protein
LSSLATASTRQRPCFFKASITSPGMSFSVWSFSLCHSRYVILVVFGKHDIGAERSTRFNMAFGDAAMPFAKRIWHRPAIKL